MLTSCASNVCVVNIDNGFGRPCRDAHQPPLRGSREAAAKRQRCFRAHAAAARVGRAPRVRCGTRILHLDAFSESRGTCCSVRCSTWGSRSERSKRTRRSRRSVPARRATRHARPVDANYVEVRLPQPRPGRARVHHHGRLVHSHAYDDAHPRHGRHEHLHDPGRSVREIRRLIARAKLVPVVRDRAWRSSKRSRPPRRACTDRRRRRALPRSRRADAIVDVTGVAIGLHRLGVERITCSPLPLGMGR